VLLLRQDDPRKCTAAKLARLRLATPIFRIRQVPRRAIVLNPFAPQVLLPGDSTLAAKSGIVAVDCSWEKAEDAFGIRMPGEPRRLPQILASNPVNYAKLHKLSSVEALAAALYIMKFKKASARLLAPFKWGEGFFSLNSEVLESYSEVLTEKDLVEAEAEFF
jgi:pre-rRNA-processing protein TSR3